MQVLTISGSTRDLSEYQVPVVIDYDLDMQSDYSDLRFLDEHEELLDYWIEEQTDFHAMVWIKVPLIPTGGTLIFMYYGNKCVRSTSDFHSTFPWKTAFVEQINAQHSSIAVDSGGFPHISYHDIENSKLKYARWNGTAWEIQIADSSDSTGIHSSIAVDSHSFPHISYFDRGNTAVRYARYSGSWEIETIEECGSDYGAYTSLVLDSNSLPHMSYRRGGTRELMYARYSGSSWEIETIDPASTSVTRLDLDIEDHPHISYHYTNGNLMHAELDGSSWETEYVDSIVDYAAIAIDSRGHIHMAYYDLGHGLKHAWNDGSSWHIEMVKYTGIISYFLGIYIDHHDRVHISYQDRAKDPALGYARWNGNSWEIELLDVDGITGNDSCMASDSYGFPHISYFTKHIGLKHAYRREHILPEPAVSIGEEIGVSF